MLTAFLFFQTCVHLYQNLRQLKVDASWCKLAVKRKRDLQLASACINLHPRLTGALQQVSSNENKIWMKADWTLPIEIIDIEYVLHHESCLHFLPFQIRHIEFGEEWERREMLCLRSLRRVKMPFEILDWEEIGVRILCLLFLWHYPTPYILVCFISNQQTLPLCII